MKKIIEVLLPILMVSSYLKVLSFSGVASILIIRRWSMAKPLSIVFINDFIDCLAIAFIALMVSVLLAYRHGKYLSFLLISASALSMIFLAFSLYFYSALISLLVGLFSTIYAVFLKKEIRLLFLARCLFSLLLLIEAVGVAGWILYLLHGGINPYTEPLPLQDFETKMIYSLSSLTPVLATLFMLSTLLLIVVKPLKPIEGSRPAELLDRFKAFIRDSISNLSKRSEKRDAWSNVFLFSALIIPVLATFLLYTPMVNTSNMTVSVDIIHYVNFLRHVQESSQNDLEFLYGVLSSDRPLTLLMIYSISRIFATDFRIVSIYLPVVLSPFFILSLYYLALNLFKNKLYSSLACFLAATGPFTTASLYGGFLANWLGLSLAYLSLAMMIKSIEQYSMRPLLLSILLSILSHLAHPVPWNFLIVAATLTALLAVAQRNSGRGILKFLATFIAVNLLYDFIKTRVLNFTGATVVAESIVSTELSLGNIVNFWPINVFMVYFHVGGAFNFPPTYIFALLGIVVFSIARFLKFDVLKMWVLAGLPLYLLGPDYVQARTLQNIPIDIFTSGGLAIILEYLSFRDRMLSALLLIFIYLLYLNNLLRFIVNLPF
jgi:hypothetical protein